MEEVLDPHEVGINLSLTQDVGELVYSKDLGKKRILVIYSSVDKHSMKGRDCGEDAIRCVVLYEDKPIGRTVRTNRIGTWKKNLGAKVRGFIKTLPPIRRCRHCSSVLIARRSRKDNKFWLACPAWNRAGTGCKGDIRKIDEPLQICAACGEGNHHRCFQVMYEKARPCDCDCHEG